MKRTFKFGDRKLGPLVQIGLICLCTYLALFAMVYTGATPEQYDIQVGAPAPIQILATKDVQDTVTTEALREAAAAAVEPSYKSADPTVVDGVLNDLNLRFAELRTLRAALGNMDLSNLSDDALKDLNDSYSFTLGRDQLITLAETSDETFDSILTDCATEVREMLNSTLPEGQESAAIKSLRADLIRNYSAQLSDIIAELARLSIRPTMLIDEAITEENRAKARDAVEPEMCVKGEVIVREGDIVTLAQYTMISSMGLLAENRLDVMLILGVALLVLLVLASLGYYLYRFNRDILYSPSKMLLLCLILTLSLGAALGLRAIHSYLASVSLGMLLVMLLIDVRLGIFVSFTLSLLISILGASSSVFHTAMLSTICAPMVAVLFKRSMLRTTTLLAGVIIGVSNFLVTLAVGLFGSAELYAVLTNALWSAGGGIFSAVLCIGAQPLLEWMFNLATPAKLIELSNPNQPLLRRLLLEASGTYHHSIIVANLAEAACSAIGANGLLARVGAYYHDIGKLKRPMYFKENQMGDNPHDRTDPRVSTAILTAHTRDGAQMAQKARIPEPVVDIIRQHHGDSPATYFYGKAVKQYGDQVDISAFRYEGPRPATREAAVVMLADSIEAATRALPNPDPEKIDALIRKIVRGKQSDGQLDNSPLTFIDIDRICSAFSTVLTGVFHERIEYPTVTIPPRTDKPAVEEPPAQEAAQPAVQAAPAPTTAQTAAQAASTPTIAQTAAQAASAPTVAQTAAQAAPTPSVGAQTSAPAQANPAQTPAAPANAPETPASPPSGTAVPPQPAAVISTGTPAPPVSPATEKGAESDGH